MKETILKEMEIAEADTVFFVNFNGCIFQKMTKEQVKQSKDFPVSFKRYGRTENNTGVIK